MITRKALRLGSVLRYSWKNLTYSFCIALATYFMHIYFMDKNVSIPPSVVAILGTALAIIMAFRNASAYDRWWGTRKHWASIESESRTFTRQALTVVDPDHIPEELLNRSLQLVQGQLGWVNAMRLQLNGITDLIEWKERVGVYFSKEDYDRISTRSNVVTQIGMLQGNAIKELNAEEVLDIYSYIQIDDTITRLTDLQGDLEAIKDTPLPRPYDYYTRAFLAVFILFFPFGMIDTFWRLNAPLLIVPVTMVVSWIFYQIYVFGTVMSQPFEFQTSVPMDYIVRKIEIDLKEIIGEKNIPDPVLEKAGVLT